MAKAGRPSKNVNGVRSTPSPPTKIEHRVQWFSLILYPREDPRHEAMLRWVSVNEPSYILIEHTRDTWTAEDIVEWCKDKGKCIKSLNNKSAFFEIDDLTPCPHYVGEPKKPHVHLLVKHINPIKPSNFGKFFQPWVSVFESCTDRETLVLYMLHRTPASMGKAPYEIEELIYSDDWTDFVNSINRNGVTQYNSVRTKVIREIEEAGCELLSQALEIVDSLGLRTTVSEYLIVNTVNANIRRRQSAERNRNE